jgi:hypothetical protein
VLIVVPSFRLPFWFAIKFQSRSGPRGAHRPAMPDKLSGTLDDVANQVRKECEGGSIVLPFRFGLLAVELLAVLILGLTHR